MKKIYSKTDKFIQKLRGGKTGVFVDNSNIYYAQKHAGWKIDFKKLKNLFKHILTQKSPEYDLGVIVTVVLY